MARIHVDVDEIELPGDDDEFGIPGLELTCSRCGHSVQVYGIEGDSARRGAVMLRDECPHGGRNFYVVE